MTMYNLTKNDTQKLIFLPEKGNPKNGTSRIWQLLPPWAFASFEFLFPKPFLVTGLYLHHFFLYVKRMAINQDGLGTKQTNSSNVFSLGGENTFLRGRSRALVNHSARAIARVKRKELT